MCQKCVCSQGSAPNPAGGAYSTPPDSLAGFKGPTSKGRGGTIRERRERKRKGGGDGAKGVGRRGWGWGEGKGHTSTSFSPLQALLITTTGETRNGGLLPF